MGSPKEIEAAAGISPSTQALQPMNSSELNVHANVSNSPFLEKSLIPRPQTTPVKDTSFITPIGFVLQKSEERKLKESIPTKIAETIEFVPHQRNLKRTALGPAKRDIVSIKREILSKESDLNELKSQVGTIRTQLATVGFENTKLEDKCSELHKQYRVKEVELKSLLHKSESVISDIQKNHELQVENMRMNIYESQYNAEKAYMTKIRDKHDAAIKKIENERDSLALALSKINDDITNNESIYKQNLRNLETSHRDNINNLRLVLQDSRASHQDDFKALADECQEMRNEVQSIKGRIEEKREMKSRMSQELQELKNKSKTSSKDLEDVTAKIAAMKASMVSKGRQIQDLHAQMDWQNQQMLINHRQLTLEEEIRRKLHNKLQELKGNIRVFCRVRPPLNSENGNDVIDVKVPDNDEEDQEIEILNPKYMNPEPRAVFNGPVSSIPKKLNFKFDRVFQMDSTNGEIFDEISQLVQTAIYGFNVCIFAYGQTGSGKTFTMSNTDGMIPRAIDQIFETCAKLNTTNDWSHKIYGEFLEIYNENINDLLNDNNGDSSKNKYEIRHDLVNQKTSVTDITKIELTSPKMVQDLLSKVYLNRSIATTRANERSSRSHSVYIIRIEGENSKTGERTSGVLNLIDLAGSERLSHSQVIGDRLKETQSINKSLSCLGDVIYALGDAQSAQIGRHIPFRNSKLTYLLQFSLLGNSKTLMFVNVSPLVKNYNETINSLRFATKVNTTHLKK